MPKFNSAKLNVYNYCPAWPIDYLGKSCYKFRSKAWELVGWTSPPYAGSAEHAIVVRRCDFDNGHPYEFGIYWFHGDANEMKFELTIPKIAGSISSNAGR